MMIQKIVIAGAGTMGSSMAQIYAEYFDAVVLYNHRQETLELAKERIESNVATLVETGNLTKEKAGSLLGALSYTTSMECFKPVILWQRISLKTWRLRMIFIKNSLK